jgi:hypothetical protein
MKELLLLFKKYIICNFINDDNISNLQYNQYTYYFKNNNIIYTLYLIEDLNETDYHITGTRSFIKDQNGWDIVHYSEYINSIIFIPNWNVKKLLKFNEYNIY